MNGVTAGIRIWAGCSGKGYRRGGFTLLMSVVALAIGVVVLASLTGVSHNRRSQVRLGAAELQYRWGSYSCQHVLLRDADRMLSQEDRQTIGFPERELRFKLGRQLVYARLADENQKLDINLMLRGRSVADVESLIDQWSTTELRSNLNLLPESDRRSRTEDGLECWDQVWTLPPGYETQQFVIGSRRLTLWGNRVHLFADEAVVRETIGNRVGPLAVQRLLRARDEASFGGGRVTVQNVVQRADLNERDRGTVVGLLTNRSTSYSLWLSFVEGRRTRNGLCVREGIPVSNDQVVERIHSFVW